MNKKINLLLLTLFLLNIGFSTNSSCSFTSGSSTWHCSNNSPGVAITPGETGNLTFYCCYTSPNAENSDEFSLIVEKMYNYTRNVQQPDKSWVVEFTEYAGTHWITDIYYNTTVHPNEDIPIIITFVLPDYDEAYSERVIHARTDVMLNTGGTFILNNVIDTKIVIPEDYEPPFLIQLKNLILNNYLFDSALLFAVVLIVYFFFIKKKK
ncbi:hypothetical protein COS64_04765 [archaeon CG06_land_8_20_14_3_00_37_11]|nr:MAG: hypothetical protein COS64_04765 [archaeon CG06_land_8_20_14_3_00_37_11]